MRVTNRPSSTVHHGQVEERDALVQLVNAQAQEMERLKAQLNVLRRKDTSMYA